MTKQINFITLKIELTESTNQVSVILLYPPLYLKKIEVSLTIFYNTILLRAKRACVFYPWSFFNVFCEFNRNVSFVCCGKMSKTNFYSNSFLIIPTFWRKIMYYLVKLGFGGQLCFSNNEEMVNEENHFLDGLKN